MKIYTYFKILSAVAILLYYSDSNAQNEAYKISSPEAAGQSGGASGVDMFRGTLNSTIPIYNFKGSESELPISISYSATGIKVEQLANNVGLGWNLNAGGRVTKMVRRVPDGTPASNYPGDNCLPYSNYEGDWSELSPDRDYYKVTAPGLDEVVRVNYSGNATCYTNPKVKVWATPGMSGASDTEWIITAADGTKYYFGQNDAVEESVSYRGGCPTITSATSWMLTKIVSKNNMDVFVFDYREFKWLNPIPTIGEQLSNHLNNGTSYKSNQMMVKEIEHNDELIMSFHYQARNDLRFIGGTTDGNALAEIQFYNFKANSFTTGEKAFRKVVFDYEYFGNTTSTNPLDVRLKLKAITAFGYNKTASSWEEGDQYSFGYEDQYQVPSLISFAQDYLGLYNGLDSNTDLVFHPFAVSNKREFNLDKALTGTLNKITYPNKGYSEFKYEQNALGGNYQRVYVPEVTESHVVSTVELIQFDDNGVCPELSMQYWEIHEDMETIDLNNIPYSEVNVPTPVNILYANSTILDLTSEAASISCKVEAMGQGIYAIQKLDPCSLPPVASFNCGLVEATTADGCLIPTYDVYYTGTSSSHTFVKTGLTHPYWLYPEQSFILEPGKYQITIWPFDDPFDPISLKVMKEIIQTTVTPDYYTISDTTSEEIDGFRIKSITNFDESGNFVSKKGYKYSDGLMTDVIRNSHPSSTTGHLQYIYSSRGYVNAPEIVHYKKVCEVALDELDQNNGYIKYHFATLNNVGSDYNTPFYYGNGSTADQVMLDFIEQKTGLLEKKEIFNKYDEVVHDEIITNSSLPFVIYETPQFGYSQPHGYAFGEHYYTSKIVSHDYLYTTNGVTNIEKSIEFVCDEGNYDGAYNPGEFPYSITQKTVNGEIENYKYGETYTPFENILSETDSPTKGITKYIYTSFNHGTTSAPIMRNLVTEIQHAKHGDTPEPISQFIYDNKGNKVQTTMTSGNGTPLSYESYIYGYNDRFIVAKLTGVPYSDIATLTARLTDIKDLSNRLINDTNEIALINELNLLRTDFPNALITTYTYNPVYGVTSVTDPKGYTVFSEYDAFGRVKLTKERHKSGNGYNIISENQYHTISNP